MAVPESLSGSVGYRRLLLAPTTLWMRGVANRRCIGCDSQFRIVQLHRVVRQVQLADEGSAKAD